MKTRKQVQGMAGEAISMGKSFATCHQVRRPRKRNNKGYDYERRKRSWC